MSQKNVVTEEKQSFMVRTENALNKHVVPVLKVVASNKYLRALMEGFYVTLPIIVFSSIIGIIMWVPPAIKGDMAWYPLVARQALNRIYVLSMGLISIWFTMGIANALAEKLNHDLPNGRKMNLTMVMFAAGTSIFMMSVAGTFALDNNGLQTENFANLLVANLGAQGMLTGIIVGLTMPWIFYVPVRFGWTIKLPKAVPQGVSQSFADIIPYGLCTLVYWGFGYIFIGTMNQTFTDALFTAIKPIFNGLDSYGFLAAVAFLTAFVWFIGVHGPSVTRPFLTPFMYTNLANNQELLAQGAHPHWALTYQFSYDFSASMGGTGATFVIPILFIVFAKSKQLKAVGIASYIPIWFQVNEPALFGAPMILNPVFALPFLTLPMINVVIYKFFIDVVGMNAAIADVPWSIPAVVGLLIGTAFDPLSALLWIILVVIDFFVYMPFVLVYDKLCCSDEIKKTEEDGLPKQLHYSYYTLAYLGTKSIFKNENAKNQYAEIKEEIRANKVVARAEKAEDKRLAAEEEALVKMQKAEAKANRKNKSLDTSETNKEIVLDAKKKVNVLVICYGAGTSAMLALSAEKGIRTHGITGIEFESAAYGTHKDKIKAADLVILSPQVKMYVEDVQMSAPKATKIITTNAKQYNDATKDKEFAYKLLKENLPAELFAKEK